MGKWLEQTFLQRNIKHMKGYTTLAIRGIQINTTMREHFTFHRSYNTKIQMISICEGVEKLEHSHVAGRNVKRCSHFGKNSCRYSVKTVYHMAQQFHFYNTLKRYKSIYPHNALYTNVHSDVPHNSRKVETTQKSINWSMIYTTEYYSAIKNQGLIHATLWMNPENITLRSLTQKITHCIIPFKLNVQNK